MIYVWLSRFLYRAAAGPQQPALPCLWAASEASCLHGRSPTPVDAGVRVRGGGEKPTHTNEALLHVSGLHHPTKWKMCACVCVCVYVCVCVCVCVSVCVCVCA